jgi:outer membrane lipoprotein-sorting protein
MIVTTTNYTREMSLEAWSRGREDSLVRIVKPEKERGTATLKAGNDIWNYLPKVNRIIKIPSSMMGASWMGSHFTNDDLIKESRMADDYANAVSFRGDRGGVRIVELTLTPKPTAAVVWGKVVVAVTEGSYLPVKIDYYDERMKLMRTMEFSDTRDIGTRRLPTRLRMTPTDKPREHTEIIYSKIEFDIPLDDSFFSLRTLKATGAP